MFASWPILIVLITVIVLLSGKIRFAYFALSFFAPFTATSAINITGEGEAGSGISVSWLIMVCLIIYYYARGNGGSIKLKFSAYIFKKINILIFGYWIFCLLSLLALYLNFIDYSGYDDFVFKSPGFDNSNLVRFLFFSVGLLFAVKFSKRATNKDVVRILDSFIWGTTAACMLGLIDYLTNIHIAANLFNTNISKYAQGYTAEGKISGPAVEPSLLVQVVGVSLAMSIPKINLSPHCSIFKQKKIFGLIFVQFLTLALSGAFTSVPVLIALVVQAFFSFRRLLHKWLLIFLVLLILIPYLTTLSEKLSTFSGLERVGSVLMAYDFFLKSPILGYGFSEITSHDLLINSLSNTGVIATGLLLMIVWKVAYSAFGLNNSNNQSYAKQAGLWSFLNLVIVMSFSGFSHPFVHFYIVLALAIWSSISKQVDDCSMHAGVVGTFRQFK